MMCSGLECNTIDWTRMAEPQEDGYDSRVTLQCAATAKDAATSVETTYAPYFFDGRVGLRHMIGDLGEGCEPAPLDHPNLEKATQLTRHHSAIYQQVQQLVSSVSVFRSPGVIHDGVTGSISGAAPGGFGHVFATLDHHAGFAEAIVHEVAHHKLRALGIQLVTATRLIRNPVWQQFQSPLRPDRLRPMTALVHAQYSYMYVCGLEVAVIRASQNPERDRRIAQGTLAIHLPKLRFSLGIIRVHIQLDAEGERFMTGFYRWCDAILVEGYTILQSLGISEKPFQHPLADAGSGADQRLRWEQCRPMRNIIAEEVEKDDRIYLCRSENGELICLNGPAVVIWDMCDGNTSIGQVCHEISQLSGRPEDGVFDDVMGTLIQLQQKQLLSL